MEAGRVLGVVPILAVLRELLFLLDPARPDLRDDKGYFAGLV